MYLVDRLLTLLVFLGLLLHLFSLLYLINELEQVPQVHDHRLSLGQQHIIHVIRQPLTAAAHNSADTEQLVELLTEPVSHVFHLRV